MKDRISTQVLSNGAIRYAEYNADGTLKEYHYLLAADEPTEAGTPLNKATFLKDATAALLGLTGNPTVDDALASLAPRCKVAVGSYVGTGTYGQSNPCRVDLGFSPKLVFVYASEMGLLTGSTGSTFKTCATMIAAHSAISSERYGELNDNYGHSGTITDHLTWGSNYFEWYSTCEVTSAPLTGRMQLNTSGRTYHYIALG